MADRSKDAGVVAADRQPAVVGTRLRRAAWFAVVVAGSVTGCQADGGGAAIDSTAAVAQVTAAVWQFHAADTARSAAGVIRLLWPEYSMLADGARLGYDEVAAGSRTFMASLAQFNTTWSDLRVTLLGPDAAVASFQFRDSIITHTGDLIRNRGTTTFVWQRRGGDWRLLFADANHRPIDP